MTEEASYRVYDGSMDDVLTLTEGFCEQLFPALAPGFVRSRLPFVAQPYLCLAEHQERIVGFKLAYRTADVILFSWLGGVLPEARRKGIAGGLMRLQHAQARSLGYRVIETRTRTSNSAMITINLRHGFEIVGPETDAHGRFVVIQRKELQEAADRMSRHERTGF